MAVSQEGNPADSSIHEFFIPPGYFRDVNVRLETGVLALAAELSLEQPDAGRVDALRTYIETRQTEVNEADQHHREALLESQYPELEVN